MNTIYLLFFLNTYYTKNTLKLLLKIFRDHTNYFCIIAAIYKIGFDSYKNTLSSEGEKIECFKNRFLRHRFKIISLLSTVLLHAQIRNI